MSLPAYYVKGLFGVSFIFFLASLTVQAYISNTITIQGSSLLELNSQKNYLEKEISELKLEYSYYASMPYLEQRAEELGFMESPNFVSNIEPALPTVLETSLLSK
jgi:hypothetical protein